MSFVLLIVSQKPDDGAMKSKGITKIITIYPNECLQESFSLKTKTVDLVVVLEKRSRGHQSHEGSSSENHESNHPTVVEIFQSGPNWWTIQQVLPCLSDNTSHYALVNFIWNCEQQQCDIKHLWSHSFSKHDQMSWDSGRRLPRLMLLKQEQVTRSEPDKSLNVYLANLDIIWLHMAVFVLKPKHQTEKCKATLRWWSHGIWIGPWAIAADSLKRT